jgi:hypothetical protein
MHKAADRWRDFQPADFKVIFGRFVEQRVSMASILGVIWSSRC